MSFYFYCTEDFSKGHIFSNIFYFTFQELKLFRLEKFGDKMKFLTLDQTALEQALSSRSKKNRIIICGSSEEQEYIEEAVEETLETAQQIIDASENIKALTWFDAKKSEIEEERGDLSETVGEWPGEVTNKQGFTLDHDILSGKALTEVLAVELEVDLSWHIPAHLKFGGWNDCPLTDVQCAVWKYWEEKYGAVIIGASHDVIEAYVENPPVTQQEAMQLAWEQYLYCYDIVDQGVETIANLAAILMNGKYWYFWWD